MYVPCSYLSTHKHTHIGNTPTHIRYIHSCTIPNPHTSGCREKKQSKQTHISSLPLTKANKVRQNTIKHEKKIHPLVARIVSYRTYIQILENLAPCKKKAKSISLWNFCKPSLLRELPIANIELPQQNLIEKSLFHIKSFAIFTLIWIKKKEKEITTI